jgi:hypothetical protein
MGAFGIAFHGSVIWDINIYEYLDSKTDDITTTSHIEENRKYRTGQLNSILVNDTMHS